MTTLLTQGDMDRAQRDFASARMAYGRVLTIEPNNRRAQDALQRVLGQGTASGLTAEQILARSALFSPAEASALTAAPDPGCCPQMTDLVIARATAARAAEPAEWP